MTSPAVKADAAASAAGPQPAGSDEVAARAWQAMRTLVLDRYDRRKKVTDALGMSFIRAKALRLVAAAPMTMRELAAGLGTDPPYTTVAVDDLERRDLDTLYRSFLAVADETKVVTDDRLKSLISAEIGQVSAA